MFIFLQETADCVPGIHRFLDLSPIELFQCVFTIFRFCKINTKLIEISKYRSFSLYERVNSGIQKTVEQEDDI